MRRILIVILIIVAGLIAVSGLFFVIKAAYLAEQGIDLTKPSTLEQCVHKTTILLDTEKNIFSTIMVDADETTHIFNKAVEITELGQVLNELKRKHADQCLFIMFHELTDVRTFNEISKIADESGLNWKPVFSWD